MLCKMPRPNEDVSPSHGISSSLSPPFTIPAHVLGRTIQNPTVDASGAGRRAPKPRPGMRIPYRNLTSQIVTQDEIAQEILKRQMKRNSAPSQPIVLVDNLRSRTLHFGAGGDSTFAKSLSQRLANQLSSQTDVEEKTVQSIPANNGMLWSQTQVEASEQNQFVSSRGCFPVKDKQSADVIHGDANGIEAAIISHSKPSISPRINHHNTSKLDKEAEKEIALKQLKELPMIKDSESAVRRKNLNISDSNMQYSLSKVTPADLKACNKVDNKECSGSDVKIIGIRKSGEVEQRSYPLQSTQGSVKVQLKSYEMNQVPSSATSDPGGGKAKEMISKASQCKFGESKKIYLKNTNLRCKRVLRSSLPNGHCKKLGIERSYKRRSTRSSVKDVSSSAETEDSSQEMSSSSNRELNKRKKSKSSISGEESSQSTDTSGNTMALDVEANASAPGCSSPKRAHISENSSLEGCGTSLNKRNSPPSVLNEHNSALTSSSIEKETQSLGETKESRMSENQVSSKPKEENKTTSIRPKRYATEVEKLMNDEGAAFMLLETGSLRGNSVSIKPHNLSMRETKRLGKRVTKTEVDKLLDEGTVNMLLEASPLGEQRALKKKTARSKTKELRRAAKQNILYKARLVKKSVLMSSSLPVRQRQKNIFAKRREMERKRKLAQRKMKLLSKKRKLNQTEPEKNGGEMKAGVDDRKTNEVNGGMRRGESGGEGVKRREAEVTNISKSPPKRERDSSVSIDGSVQRVSLPLEAKASRIIRRHSSSSSFSSRSSSPIGVARKGRRGSTSSNSAKETFYPMREMHGMMMKAAVASELLNDSQLKSSVEQSRLNCVRRCAGDRKLVAMPRMSAAVRLKLNTEMSKNFQKGLNVESAKCISAKTSMTPKTKRSPLSSETSLKLNPVFELKPKVPNQAISDIQPSQLKGGLSDIKILPSGDVVYSVQSWSNPTSVVHAQPVSVVKCSLESAKRLELLHGRELAVCVKKLQERKDVSITAIDEHGERTMDFSNAVTPSRPVVPPKSPETQCGPGVISRQPSSSGVMVDVVPKLKKFKNPKAPFLKNIIGKEHRIIGLPLSPIASYNSVMKSLENVTQKHKKKANTKIERPIDSKECFRQRSSGRQNAGTYNYKEICLRRYENFVQVILTPGSTKMKNSLNVQVLHEFRDVLQQLRRDEFCRVVLVTSTGSTFCQGLDLHSLLHTNTERRKKAALELSEALKEFLRVLAMFNKPIVAGVNGATVGLGVTMLPYFDVVYASDKATFHAPYARLGQIPEGAAVLTLPLMLGNAVTSELLFGSRKLTASEALHYGLVTRVFWPDTFQEELIPNIRAMASQSSQSMQAMKALLRLNLRVKLEATLDSESSLLVQHWCSPECQRNFRKFLETSDELFLQRQKKDPC